MGLFTQIVSDMMQSGEKILGVFVILHKKVQKLPWVFYLICFVNYLIILYESVDIYSNFQCGNAYKRVNGYG